MTQAEHSKKSLYYLQLASAAIGVLLSVYLLVHHTRVKNGIQEGKSFCALGEHFDCDVVSSSPYSEILGVPLASIGALFFFAVLVILILAPPRDANFGVAQRVLAWVAALGLLYDLILFLAIQVVLLRSVCILCVTTYLCVVVFLWAGLRLNAGGARGWKNRARALFKGSGKWRWQRVAPIKWIPLGLCFLLFVVMLILLPSFIKQDKSAYNVVDSAVEQYYVTFREQARREIPVNKNDGTFGNPDSKVKIVIFSDFQCPFCKRAAFTIHNALNPIASRVWVTFKHYPLDSSCNPKLTYQMHPFACRLARLAYCAEKKDKFWPYHDYVFLQLDEERLKEGFDAVESDLKDIFTPTEIKACLSDSRSLESVTRDIEAGNRLNVRATPSVFINGKFVTIPLTVESLRRLVAIEESIVGN